MERYDLIVIGSGPAGEKGAAQAAYFGKRVALVERASFVGGAGVNTGTIPSKTLREAALYFSGIKQRGLYGVDYTFASAPTVREFMHREQEVVRSLREVVEHNLGRHRIDLFHGEASLEDPHTVRVRPREAGGDVIGFPALAATSMEQARVAMCHAYDLKYKTRVAPILPFAIYTIPEVSTVGETEESCRAKGIRYAVGRSLYGRNPRGQIIGDLTGQIKLTFRAPEKTLLGVHIIGEDAAELIHVGVMVMLAGGTIDSFIDAVFNYPTLSDAYKYAAYDGLAALKRLGD